jgi:lysozyme
VFKLHASVLIRGSNAPGSAPGGGGGNLKAGALALAAKSIIRSEGVRLHPYNDLDPNNNPKIKKKGNCTIGAGHKLHDGACNAADYRHYPKPLTDQQVDQYLQQDMRKAANAVSRYVKVDLNAHEQAALIAFTFNIGVDAFKGSTLLRELNAGDRAGAADQILRWTYSGGRHLQGLADRRNRERNLFLGMGPARDIAGVSAILAAATSDHNVTEPSLATTSLTPTVSVSGAIIAGRTARISGTGVPAGCVVALQALVSDVSPYPIYDLPTTRAQPNGTYSIVWSVPRGVTDTLPWQITANEDCTRPNRAP